MARILYVISYDVADDKRRRRLVLNLEGAGRRVQKSVFETFIAPGDLSEVVARCRGYINEDAEDSLRVYRICANCTEHFLRFGGVSFDWDKDIIL